LEPDVGSGFLFRRSLDKEGLRNEPFTLANEGLLEMDASLWETFGCGLCRLTEEALEIEFSRSLFLRPLRSPTFSTVSSFQDRSALNMAGPAMELATKVKQVIYGKRHACHPAARTVV
jgi:hypothetical protein